MSQPWTEARWKKFVRDYRREMSQPAPRQLIELLARPFAWRRLFGRLLLRARGSLPQIGPERAV
jgi:hypothetical protein